MDDIRYKIEFSSSVSSLSHLFYGCIHLRSIKSIETKGITDFSFMFAPRHDPEKLFGFTGCSRLVRVPDMNTSSGKNFRGMFAGCSGLSTVPNLDLGNASDLSGMFASCSSLITVPPIRVFKSANMEGMFADCTALLTKPAVEKYAGAGHPYPHTTSKSSARLDRHDSIRLALQAAIETRLYGDIAHRPACVEEIGTFSSTFAT